jgi:hypothetical protein
MQKRPAVSRKTSFPHAPLLPKTAITITRFPIRWNHLIEKESLRFKELEHVPNEKVDQFFRNMLRSCAFFLINAHESLIAPLRQQRVHSIKIFLHDVVLIGCGCLRPFLQRLAIGRDRLRELPRPALPFPEPKERSAEIVLCPRPLGRNAFSGPFLQRGAIGRDRLLQTRRPALPLPERCERNAETHLRRRPLEGNALARHLLQRRAIGRDRLLELPRPTLPLPSLKSAVPSSYLPGRRALSPSRSRPKGCERSAKGARVPRGRGGFSGLSQST